MFYLYQIRNYTYDHDNFVITTLWEGKFLYTGINFQHDIFIMKLKPVTFAKCLLCVKPRALPMLILYVTLGISSESFHFTDAQTKDLKTLLTCSGSLSSLVWTLNSSLNLYVLKIQMFSYAPFCLLICDGSMWGRNYRFQGRTDTLREPLRSNSVSVSYTLRGDPPTPSWSHNYESRITRPVALGGLFALT